MRVNKAMSKILGAVGSRSNNCKQEPVGTLCPTLVGIQALSRKVRPAGSLCRQRGDRVLNREIARRRHWTFLVAQRGESESAVDMGILTVVPKDRSTKTYIFWLLGQSIR